MGLTIFNTPLSLTYQIALSLRRVNACCKGDFYTFVLYVKLADFVASLYQLRPLSYVGRGCAPPNHLNTPIIQKIFEIILKTVKFVTVTNSAKTFFPVFRRTGNRIQIIFSLKSSRDQEKENDIMYQPNQFFNFLSY